MCAHAQRKLALAMFAIELDQRIGTEKKNANCLYQGSFLDTNMVRRAGFDPQGTAESGTIALGYLATALDAAGDAAHIVTG